MLETRGPEPAELLAALPVAVLVVDAADRIARVNAECETLLNLSERALLGQPLAAILSFPDAEARRDAHAFAIFDADVETMRGLRLRVDLIEAAVVDHPGWRTITLHHAGASRRLGVSTDRAAAARSAVGAAAMLAHEIKNPLSSIRGAAQLIADGVDTAELTQLMIAEVDRITALIDHMEDFTDTRPREVSPMNIYPLLAHARGVALAGFARGVAIEERYDPSLPRAMGNSDSLLQVILNLLSIGAAYGVLVAVFQWGDGKQLIGVDKNGPIEAWIPMMMFAIVFGLSMDYEVFLLSRIREEYLRTGDSRLSVADGLAATARVITAAAAIMVVVFGSFIGESDRIVKLFGVGLASAVFLDATIVRMLLVPATMELLGDSNWWLPRWLDRALPKVAVEGEDLELEPELETA